MFSQILEAMKATEAQRKERLNTIWRKGFEGMHQGPWLLCCGEWQPITKTPHACWRCRRLYFEGFPRHD